MENDRKCTPQKIIEKSHLENNRMENAYPENDRKITYWKMTKDTQKMKEWKVTLGK